MIDHDLITRAQSGDREAQEELLSLVEPRLRRLAARAQFWRSVYDEEDLFQEAMVRILNRLHAFDPQKASFLTWCYRQASGAFLDARRTYNPLGVHNGRIIKTLLLVHQFSDLEQKGRRQRGGNFYHGEFLPELCREGDEAAVDHKDEARVFLRRLTGKPQFALVMRYWDGASGKEIGEQIGLSENRSWEVMREALGYLRETVA